MSNDGPDSYGDGSEYSTNIEDIWIGIDRQELRESMCKCGHARIEHIYGASGIEEDAECNVGQPWCPCKFYQPSFEAVLLKARGYGEDENKA